MSFFTYTPHSQNLVKNSSSGPAQGEEHSPLQIPAHLTVTRGGGKKYLYIEFEIFKKITGLTPKDLPSPFLYSGADFYGKTFRAVKKFIDNLNDLTNNLLPF
jgi:hypothetical protein